MAFLRGDQAVMQRELAWASGRSGEEDWLLSSQSDTEAYFGRLTSARQLSQRLWNQRAAPIPMKPPLYGRPMLHLREARVWQCDGRSSQRNDGAVVWHREKMSRRRRRWPLVRAGMWRRHGDS
jgi:hypothetical protein